MPLMGSLVNRSEGRISELKDISIETQKSKIKTTETKVFFFFFEGIDIQWLKNKHKMCDKNKRISERKENKEQEKKKKETKMT